MMLAVGLGLVWTVLPAFGAGLIIVEDARWHPGPMPPPILPPHPPRPWPPPRQHVFAPLEVSYVKAHTRITDQVAATTVRHPASSNNPVILYMPV